MKQLELHSSRRQI